MSDKTGAVMVVGGGISGVQTALDLAESGFQVYLIEKTPSIGGVMSQLDKTFPTNDCSMCILSPKLVEAARHPLINLMTMSEVTEVSGEAPNFQVKVRHNPRYVSMEKCVGCGICAEKCPVKVPNEYDANLINRKAIYIPYAQAVPLKYSIDASKCLKITKGRCGLCEKNCPAGAINYEDKAVDETLDIGAIMELSLRCQGLFRRPCLHSSTRSGGAVLLAQPAAALGGTQHSLRRSSTSSARPGRRVCRSPSWLIRLACRTRWVPLPGTLARCRSPRTSPCLRSGVVRLPSPGSSAPLH